VLYTSRNGHAFYREMGDNLSNEHKSGVYEVGLVNRCSKGKAINVADNDRTQLIAASFLGATAPMQPRWLQMPWRWGRYFDFTAEDVSGIVAKALGPVLALTPAALLIETIVGEVVVSSGVLGHESNSAGPQAIKFKDNWFGAENS
jgi:hypothetical protein